MAGDKDAERNKKAILVCCGNSQKKRQQEVYTSLMDATSLRLQVKIAAVKHCDLGSIDIRTAFRHAPLKGQVAAVMPPPFLVALGLCDAESCAEGLGGRARGQYA